MAGNVIATLLVEIGVKFAGLNEGVKQVEKKLGGLKGTLQKHGKTTAKIFGGIAAGIGAGLGLAVKKAADFQVEMVALGRISNTSGQALTNLGKKAMKMGVDFGVSSKDVVRGMADMSKLGFSTSRILSEMPAILKFSSVKGIEFSKALAITESAMSVFKLGVGGAKRVTDTFLYTMDKSTATMNDLTQGFKYAAPSATRAGWSIGELSAAIGILAKNGTTGSTAGTTLRQALNRLSSGAPKVAKEMDKIGFSMLDSNGKMKDGKTQIADLQKAFQNLSPAQQTSTANTLFGTAAASGMLKILGEAPEVFQQLATGADNAGGAIDKAFIQKKKTFEESLKSLKVSLENFGIVIGTAIMPAVQKVIDALTDLIKWFNDLDPSTQAAIGYIAGLVAAIAGLTAAVLIGNAAWGKVSGAVAIVTQAWSALSLSAIGTAVKLGILNAQILLYNIYAGFYTVAAWASAAATTALGVAFNILTAPITLIIIAIGLVVLALVLLWNKNEAFRNFIIAAWEKIKAFFAGIPGFFRNIWNTVTTATSNAWNKIKQKVSDTWTAIKNSFTSFITTAVQWGKNLVKGIADGIMAGIKWVKDAAVSVGRTIKKFLGFGSPTDEGPLARSDEWIPNFMNMMTQGIEMGIPKLRMAVGDVAATLDLGSGRTSSTTNNVNVYPQRSNMDARGLTRELGRMSWLNGGNI